MVTDSRKQAADGNDASMMPSWDIPVIDLSTDRVDYGEEGQEERLARELVRALETIGFATLLHHGVDTEGALYAARQFFALDLSTKLQYPYQGHDSNRGYIPVGRECHQEHGAQGAINSSSADAKETFELDDRPETEWPRELEGSTFRTTLLRYYNECHHLHLRLLRLLAIGLQLPPDAFASQCDARHCNLRLLHYPALTVQASAAGGGVVVRGARHTDFGTLTLLVQDHVGGLRVQPKQQPRYSVSGSISKSASPGEGWIAVPPTPGALVVNVGDMLQRWTNNRLVATPHQVVSLLLPSDEGDRVHPMKSGDPEEAAAGVRVVLPERYSVAFFCNANPETVLQPMAGLIREGESSKYQPMTAKEYLTQRLAATIRTASISSTSACTINDTRYLANDVKHS